MVLPLSPELLGRSLATMPAIHVHSPKPPGERQGVAGTSSSVARDTVFPDSRGRQFNPATTDSLGCSSANDLKTTDAEDQLELYVQASLCIQIAFR